MTWQPTIDEYHADAAISSSSLAVFFQSPRLYEGRYITRTIDQPAPTPPMILGSRVHCRLLEPNIWSRDYILMPPNMAEGITTKDGKPAKNPRATVEYKRRLAGFLDLAAGREIIEIDDLNVIDSICESAQGNKFAMGLLRDWPGQNEVSHKWVHHTGLELRCRFDRVTDIEGEPVIPDLKIWSCDPTAEAINARIENSGTYRQRALYRIGYHNMTGRWPMDVLIIVHSEPPHEINMVFTCQDHLRLGHMENEAALAEMAERYQTNDWSTYAEQNVKASQPRPWTGRRLERAMIIDDNRFADDQLEATYQGKG